jgi:hypothetical protein
MGVQSALYRCHTKGCYASISLKTHKVGEVNEVFDPMVVTNLNFKHKEGVRFPKSMWNHWDNHDERTNNRVEGDNNKMKNF